jgi:hypothetical protein
MFKFNNGYFTNIQNGKKITVSGGTDKEAQPVWVYNKYKGRHPSQVWKIVYTNEMGSEAYRKKGQMSKDSGLRALEPFYLRSRLPMQRVAECVGASNITLKKWAKGRKA